MATVVLPTKSGTVLKIRKGSAPEPQHSDIYKELRIPSEVMKPVKTWYQEVKNNDCKKYQIPVNTRFLLTAFGSWGRSAYLLFSKGSLLFFVDREKYFDIFRVLYTGYIIIILTKYSKLKDGF